MANKLNHFRTISVWGCYFVIFAILSGCAIGRGEINLRLSEAKNPSTGTAVKIVQVTDDRRFEIAPSIPSIPSLADGAINNKAITSLAVARKRNWMGVALGDILLPEGRTVAQITKEAITVALREGGYRVLVPQDPDYERAVPLNITVKEFWAWSTVAHLEFKTKVQIDGNIGAVSGTPISGVAKKTLVLGSDSEWVEVITTGMNDLVKNVRAKLP